MADAQRQRAQIEDINQRVIDLTDQLNGYATTRDQDQQDIKNTIEQVFQLHKATAQQHDTTVTLLQQQHNTTATLQL